MLDMRFLIGAIIIMLVIIVNDILKKKTSFDMDKIDVAQVSKNFIIYLKRLLNITIKKKYSSHNYIIEKNTGKNSLYLASCGENSATVMATLRQITGISRDHAKWIVQAAPTLFVKNISDDEADMTKKALEFVGAKVEIK